MTTQSVLVGETTAYATSWRYGEQHCRLTRLCGIPVGQEGEDAGPSRAQGVAILSIDGHRYEGGDLQLESTEETGDGVCCRWRVGATALRLTTRWQVCRETGIVSRRDTLTNAGDAAVTVARCLARVAFPPGRYACYTQASRWCHENQGTWQPLHTGILLRHAWGRTTEGSTPYLAVRAIGTEAGVAFHVLPSGNWTIKVTPVTAGGDLPFAVVELGLADENLHHVLRPGETLTLPEILLQPLPLGDPHLAAPALHRYLLAHHFANAKPEAPVVYNTWFDEFELLDVPRLRRQLEAAQSVGCEVFVIDAGWYGAGGPNWWAQTGDWREKTEAAFRGQMRAFADEVRAAGLGFGLWMEPERFGAEAPIRTAHPEWFVPVGEAARLNLTQPAACAYLRGEIGRLVETYGLAWMKLDFNFALDADDAGEELGGYTAAWYRLLDEIRAAYPATFFEGCSSGAMRGDLAILSHVDGHFLSDSVNPIDMLRISQGAWLRLPPGRITRWAVVRSAGQAVPRYGSSVADSPATVLTPCGALWEPAESVDLSFALLTALPGLFGVSGDLASLSAADRAIMRQGIAYYKAWRRLLTKAVAYLLTAPELLTVREGWIGVQLQAPDDDTSLVLVYRLGACGAPPPMRLHGLQPEAHYRITRGFAGQEMGQTIAGQLLMTQGLPLDGIMHGSGHGAAVYEVCRIK